jgi:hypothetical protein
MLLRNNVSTLALLFLAVVCLTAMAQKAAPAIKTGTVKGLVINSVSGEPVIRAHVVLNGLSVGNVYGAITTADGRFSMLSVPPGAYSVATTHRGYQPSMNFPSAPQITVKAGEDLADLTVRLIPSAVIIGQVVDDKNRPLHGASVEAIGEDSRESALSDDRGRFRIAGLSSESFLVKAKLNGMLTIPEIRTDGTVPINYGSTYYPSAPSPESAVAVQTHAGHETADIVIKLKPAPLVRISGIVTGNPPGSTGISLAVGSQNGATSVQLDAMNRFTLWGLDQGSHSLFAHWVSGDKLFRSGATTFYVADTNVDNLVVAVMPPFNLVGKVAAELALGKTDQDAWPSQYRKLLVISAEGLADPMFAMRVTLDASGDFKIPDFSAGRYRFSLEGFPDHVYVKDIQSENLKLENGVLDLNSGPPSQPLKVELGTDGGQITGKLLTPDDKPATARVGLLIRSTHGYSLLQQVTSNGSFSFTGVPPGKYFLLPRQNWDGSGMSAEEFAAIFAGMMEQVDVGSGEKVAKDLKLPPGDTGH